MLIKSLFQRMVVTMMTVIMVLIVSIPVLSYSTDVEAKSYRSSGGFSRSSIRSNSSSKRSGFWGSKSKAISKPKSLSKPKIQRKYSTTTKQGSSAGKKTFTSNNKGNTSGSKFAKNRSGGAFTKSRNTRASKASLNKQRSKFKKPAYTPTGSAARSASSTRNSYGSRKSYTRARNYDRSTYYSRRTSYYSGYNAPMYVYGAAPSYGLWDTIFLYSMLNSMNSNSHASSFAHNHRNDADYRAWRNEADSLAKDNADLRKQLAQMDAGSAKMSGQPVDPDYIPKGIDADLAMSQEALSSQRPTMNLCVASKTGTYQRIGNAYRSGLNSVNINTINTAGSNEILKKVADGSCDAGFVQGDGYWNYVEDNNTDNLPFTRALSTHKEAVHLFCHEDGPTSASDLSSKHKLWFPVGSGAAGTFQNWIAEDDDYADVQTVFNNPSMSVTSNEAAVMKIAGDKNSCALYVGAQGASAFVKKMDKIAKASHIVLVNITDGSLDNTEDPSGADVYDKGTMDAYSNLNRNAGTFGMMSGKVDSMFLNADLIVGTKWQKANQDLYPTLVMDMMAMQSDINIVVTPR